MDSYWKVLALLCVLAGVGQAQCVLEGENGKKVPEDARLRAEGVSGIGLLREPSGAPAVEARTLTIQAANDPIECKTSLKPLRGAITLSRLCPADPSCLEPGLVLERRDYSVRDDSIVEEKRKVVLRHQRCDN